MLLGFAASPMLIANMPSQVELVFIFIGCIPMLVLKTTLYLSFWKVEAIFDQMEKCGPVADSAFSLSLDFPHQAPCTVQTSCWSVQFSCSAPSNCSCKSKMSVVFLYESLLKGFLY